MHNLMRITAGGIVEHEGKILVIKLQHLREDARIVYTTGGGHVERGETIIEALKREFLEETGYDIEPTHLIGVYPQNFHDHDSIRFSFACSLNNPQPIAEPEEGILSIDWLEKDEILALKDQWRPGATSKTFEDYFAGAKFPLETITQLRHDE